MLLKQMMTSCRDQEASKVFKIGNDVIGRSVSQKYTPRYPYTKEDVSSLKPVMKSVNINTLMKSIPNGLTLTAKLNGDFNLFHYIKGVGIYSMNRYGTTRGKNLPHVQEVMNMLDQTGIHEAVLLGETYSVTNEKMDPLPTYIHKIRSEDPQLLKDIRVAFFDLVMVDGKRIAQPYDFRLSELESWIHNGQQVHVVPNIKVNSLQDVEIFWKEWVESGNYEGIVARDELGNIFKVKPHKSVDAVLIGINKKDTLKEGIVTSVCMALMSPEGKFVKLSDVTVSDAKLKKALFNFYQTRIIREDKNTIFIKPEVIFEVGYIDELKSERPVFAAGLNPSGNMPFVSLVSPKILRLRDDKTVNPKDLSLSQVEFESNV